MSATHSASARQVSSSVSHWLARHTWQGSTGAGLLHEAAHVVEVHSPTRTTSATPEGCESTQACVQAASPAAQLAKQVTMAVQPGLAPQSQKTVLHWANMQSLHGSPGETQTGAPPAPPAPLDDDPPPMPPMPPVPLVAAEVVVEVAGLSPPLPPCPLLLVEEPPPSPPPLALVLVVLVLVLLAENCAGSSLPQAMREKIDAEPKRARAERKVMGRF
jgi:hypothetical protein